MRGLCGTDLLVLHLRDQLDSQGWWARARVLAELLSCCWVADPVNDDWEKALSKVCALQA